MKKRLNVFLLTDMEGVAGIDSIDDMDRESERFSLSRKKLCAEINLAVDACFEGGADRVYYLDGHAGGGNVIESLIDPCALKCSLADWQTLLATGEIDCQIELGAHARPGTVGGFLDHTLSSRTIYSVKINAREMSEFALHAMLCAKYKVPIVAVTGDEVACMQAREYVHDVFVGAVKRASCRNVALTYPNAESIIRKTILQALAKYNEVSLIPFTEPLTVEYTYYRTDMCEDALANCKTEVQRPDARTLCKVSPTLSCYADLKI